MSRVTVAVLTAAAVLLAVAGAVAERQAVADSAVRFCVHDLTRKHDVVRAAVDEFADVPEVEFTYRPNAGSCPVTGAVLVEVTDRRVDPALPPGWIEWTGEDEIAVRLNYVTDLTAEQWRLVVLHELMHAVTYTLDPSVKRHTQRCDSVLSDNRACVFSVDSLTGFDREWIRKLHRSHRVATSTPTRVSGFAASALVEDEQVSTA